MGLHRQLNTNNNNANNKCMKEQYNPDEKSTYQALIRKVTDTWVCVGEI